MASNIRNNYKEFEIKKIHFLLLCYATNEIISYEDKIRCRELETNIWEEYIGADFYKENILAYHWFKKADSDKKIDSFNTLIKIKYNKSNLIIISAYIIAIGLINLFSNDVYNFFYNRFISNTFLDNWLVIAGSSLFLLIILFLLGIKKKK